MRGIWGMGGVLAAVLAAGVSGCFKPEPVRVGFIGGLTGRAADLGVAGRNGVMLAVEQHNAIGGVQGRPLELTVVDDAQDPEVARRVFEQLLRKRVEVVVGPMTSSVATVVVPLANEAKTALISPTVTTKELSALDDHFLRVCSTTETYAAESARYHAESLGCRRAAAVYDLGNRSYTESWLRDFRKTFERYGGKIAGTVTFRSGGEASFSTLAGETLQGRPDLVVVIANSLDAAQFCQWLRKRAPKMPLALAEWAATERVIEVGGASVEGAVVSQFFDRGDRSERYLAFLEAYQERFGQQPGFAGVAGYDAARVALQALEMSRPGQSIKEAILSRNAFQGVQHPLQFDRFGDADRKAFLSTVRNGQFVMIR